MPLALERVALPAVDTGVASIEPIDAMFVFIGTLPHSEWLTDAVLRDSKGFVLTGREAAISDRFARY